MCEDGYKFFVSVGLRLGGWQLASWKAFRGWRVILASWCLILWFVGGGVVV